MLHAMWHAETISENHDLHDADERRQLARPPPKTRGLEGLVKHCNCSVPLWHPDIQISVSSEKRPYDKISQKIRGRKPDKNQEHFETH